MDNVLKEKLQPIKLLICDVDGVLTDGKLIYMTNGEEAKNFSVLDGVGFHMLNRLDLDIKTAWITGRECATTAHRANKLKIDNCLLYTSPSPRDKRQSRMPSSA